MTPPRTAATAAPADALADAEAAPSFPSRAPADPSPSDGLGPRAHSQVRSDLRAMYGDGVAFSVMVGSGESYLPAFALALGYGAVTAGFVATLPMLAGALMQLVTPAAVGLLDSHRRWVVLCAGLQALCFVPLIAGALAGRMELWLLYLAASLYWGLGMSTGPAWNAWASTLVPARLRARYFARRTRGAQAALVTALLAGGFVLEAGAEREQAMLAFAALFAAALLARAVSAGFLAAQSEARPAPIGETSISPAALRSHLRTGRHGRLLLYMLVFQLAVWVAAPYFTPYMLGPLGLSYVEFTLLTTTAFLARVIALPAVGRLIHRFGTKHVLAWSSVGIVPLPALWLVSDSFGWLLALQLLSGTAWAAFELASLLSFFERIPLRGRTSILTVYNLANALAIVGGSLLGGALIEGAGERVLAGFVAVLVISTVARAAALWLLRGVPTTAEPGPVPPLRTLSVRPSSGAVQRPVLTGALTEVA